MIVWRARFTGCLDSSQWKESVSFRSLDIVAAVRDGRLDNNAAATALSALNGAADFDLEFWTVLME